MRKIGIIFIALFLCLTGVSACSKSTTSITSEEKSSKTSGLVVLDRETISLFKKGMINGIPFKQDGHTSIDEITKKWGKPDKINDYEDIKDYVYLKKGQKVTFVVDETNIAYITLVEFNMTLKEANQKLGNLHRVKKTTRILEYPMGNYEVQVEQLSKDRVLLSLHVKKSE